MAVPLLLRGASLALLLASCAPQPPPPIVIEREVIRRVPVKVAPPPVLTPGTPQNKRLRKRLQKLESDVRQMRNDQVQGEATESSVPE